MAHVIKLLWGFTRPIFSQRDTVSYLPPFEMTLIVLSYSLQQMTSSMAASLIGQLGLNAAGIVVSGLCGHARDTVPILHPPMVARTVMVKGFN